MNVIYIGSGKSAELINKIDYSKYTVACVNNAWKLFEGKNKFNYWIHSGDFPHENRPKIKNFDYEISYKEYEIAAMRITKEDLKIVFESESPHDRLFYVGYTIFFLGLYWIFKELKPQNIYLLGFDHDYNQGKVEKWLDSKTPNLQNNFHRPHTERGGVNEWCSNFFSNFETDFFYGHGTPDPMRLGTQTLKTCFKNALENSKKLQINVMNASPVENTMNIFPKININDL